MKKKIGIIGTPIVGTAAAAVAKEMAGGKLVNLPKDLPKRVKLLDLPENAQAVVHIREDVHMEMLIYAYAAGGACIQFVAPFTFESEDGRNGAFENTDMLIETAKAIFVKQMQTIDPNFNTDNFKPAENE